MKTTGPITTGMRERRAQVVLLVRAFEETDRDGRILTPYARMAATRRAITVTGLSEYEGELSGARNMRNGETVIRRSRLLFGALERKVPVLRGVLHVAQLGASTAPTIIGTAVVLGLLTNLLGPRRAINLISLPIMGLIAWNLGIYAATAAYAIARRSRGGGSDETGFTLGGSWIHQLAGFFLKGALWRRFHGRRIERSGDTETRITTKALVRFAALWHRVAGPLLISRVRRMLHVGAVAVLVGAVAGMYVRGFAFEYRATWESTWLEASQVQSMLELVLGPASAVLGIAVPDVAPLQGPERSGEAAAWIHLWAMTAILFVVLPRVILALFETWRGSRLAARLPIDLSDSYFARIFTAWRGASRIVNVVPYSFRPGAGEVDALRRLLQDYFGARAEVRTVRPVSYGEAASTVVPEQDDPDHRREQSWVVLFNLAQSPEPEVHGAFLEELKDMLGSREEKLLAMVETSGYRRRIADERREKERLDAWRRVLRDAGMTAVEVTLDTPAGEAVLDALGAGLWPRAEPIGARQ